jgi:uncharacterized membrane protein
MKIIFTFYNVILALWVGGMAFFTFLFTPAIFKAYPRDVAGAIVGILFPGYFIYNLVLAALALLLLAVLAPGMSRSLCRFSLVLAAAALAVNVYVVFQLHPQIVRVKQQVSSFQEAPDSPVRKQFRRLHAVSAACNLFLLADGIALLVAAPFCRK